MLSDYSEKEQTLFYKLNQGHLIQIIDPVGLYKITMERAFIGNEQGPAIEALRKACGALNRCNPYRHTKEFDELITF